MMNAIGPGAMKRAHVYQDLESRVLLYDLMNYGDRAVREYEPPQPGLSLYVPENHWFYLLRRFVSISDITPSDILALIDLESRLQVSS